MSDPFSLLRPSSAFWASSKAIFWKDSKIDTTRIVSPSSASASMMSGMTSTSALLRGIARTNFSPYGSRWMPFISSTVSIARILSSSVRSCPCLG